MTLYGSVILKKLPSVGKFGDYGKSQGVFLVNFDKLLALIFIFNSYSNYSLRAKCFLSAYFFCFTSLFPFYFQAQVRHECSLALKYLSNTSLQKQCQSSHHLTSSLLRYSSEVTTYLYGCVLPAPLLLSYINRFTHMCIDLFTYFYFFT